MRKAPTWVNGGGGGRGLNRGKVTAIFHAVPKVGLTAKTLLERLDLTDSPEQPLTVYYKLSPCKRFFIDIIYLYNKHRSFTDKRFMFEF